MIAHNGKELIPLPFQINNILEDLPGRGTPVDVISQQINMVLFRRGYLFLQESFKGEKTTMYVPDSESVSHCKEFSDSKNALHIIYMCHLSRGSAFLYQGATIYKRGTFAR